MDIYSLDPGTGQISLTTSMQNGPKYVRFGMYPGRAFGETATGGAVIAYGVDQQTGLLTEKQSWNHGQSINFVVSSGKEVEGLRSLAAAR